MTIERTLHLKAKFVGRQEVDLLLPKGVLCRGLDREVKAKAAFCSPKTERAVDGSPGDKMVDVLAYTIEGLTWS